MPRDIIETQKKRTTIIISELLLNSVLEHTKQRESFSDFVSRALVNQLERESYQQDIRHQLGDTDD